MTDTSHSGPIRTGPGSTSQGTLAAVRRISVSADGPSAPISLPNCDISRIWVNVETAWEGSAGTTSSIRFGTSADQTKYGSVVVSGVAMYDVTVVSGLALRNLAEGAQLVVDVTTVGTAGVGVASTYVQYHQLT